MQSALTATGGLHALTWSSGQTPSGGASLQNEARYPVSHIEVIHLTHPPCRVLLLLCF